MGFHSLCQGIFLTHGSKPGFLHCTQIFYHLSHQGSPILFVGTVIKLFYVLQDILFNFSLRMLHTSEDLGSNKITFLIVSLHLHLEEHQPVSDMSTLCSISPDLKDVRTYVLCWPVDFQTLTWSHTTVKRIEPPFWGFTEVYLAQCCLIWVHTNKAADSMGFVCKGIISDRWKDWFCSKFCALFFKREIDWIYLKDSQSSVQMTYCLVACPE